MGKIGEYNPAEKYKNYSRPTSKPLRSHALYQEKVWTLQDQISKKLQIIAKLLKNLRPTLTNDSDKHVKVAIENNLEILTKNLDLMQTNLQKDPSSFNTTKLKTNQHRIDEMKNICNNLQVFRSYEPESKNLSKIKHTLNELEHLVQPTKLEKKLEEQRAKNKPKAAAATGPKKTPTIEATKTTKKKPLVAATIKKAEKKPPATATTKKAEKKPLASPKKTKTSSNKANSKAKLLQPKKSKKSTQLKRKPS